MTTAFNVYLHGKKIDTVFYNDNFKAEEVKESLINHDGYEQDIKVVKARKLRKK